MTLRTLLFAYLLGGLTFLPLLGAAVLAAAWYFLPKIEDVKRRDGADDHGDADGASQAEEVANKAREARQNSFGEMAASGTFAVLRTYDFEAAVGALNARNNTANSTSSQTGGDGNAAVDGHTGGGSESVYQSMYRSVFVGNRNSTSIHDTGDTPSTLSARRKAVPASVLYIVLRHGHLMLYDSPAQVEVKHVISLAHHKVSLQAGRDDEEDAHEKGIIEADLFTKRTAIVLTPVEPFNGMAHQSGVQRPPKPFYLFCATNIDKEDFYRALLYTRPHPPIPRQLNADALVKLQSSLHSSSLTPETRALNALLGRVFLGVHETDRLVNFVQAKIEKKLNRIQKPSFIPSIKIQSLDLGDAAPIFSNLKLRDLNISGDTTISADMRYTGGLSITLLAVAKLDLGPRFKTRTVDLVLKTSVRRIQGTMLIHVKPAPTNRLWFCFESMPELEIRVEPVVSERKITYGFVLRAIEERVRAAFGEGLVKPNWDDVPMPLQDTIASHARGGVWVDEGKEHHPDVRPGGARVLTDRKEKNLSTVSLPPLSRDDVGASTGLSSNSDVGLAKLRHSATVPVDIPDSKRQPEISQLNGIDSGSTPPKSSRPPRPLRSPSISSVSPSVAMDGQNVEPVRSDDAALRSSPSQNRRLWRTRTAAAAQQQQKDALEGLRDIRARVEHAVSKTSASTNEEVDSSRRHSDPNEMYEDAPDVGSRHSRQHSESSLSTISAAPRSFSIATTDSDASTAATSVSSAKAQQLQQKKANILAAAGAATSAARSWGWNTYQKNKGAFQRGGQRQDQAVIPSEPIGRGQPLPPPGMPLPGPNKGLWSGIGDVRRKPAPALPPRPRQTSSAGNSVSQVASARPSNEFDRSSQRKDQSPVDDEFGTWQENSGVDDALEPGSGTDMRNSVNSNQFSAVKGGSTPDLQPALHQATEEKSSPLHVTESESVGTRQLPAGRSKTEKVPPPLPSRTRNADHTSTQSSMVDTLHSWNESSTDTTPNNESQTEKSEVAGLRVPEDAASAIAAENATAELSHGEADDPKHVDESKGINTEIRPDLDSKTLHDQRDDSNEDEDPETARPRATSTNADERFKRGEDVAEEDFDEVNEIEEESNGLVVAESQNEQPKIGKSVSIEEGAGETERLQGPKAQAEKPPPSDI